MKNTDYNTFTHMITMVINLNILYTKAYNTNMNFPEILIALASNTTEILHSLENSNSLTEAL